MGVQGSLGVGFGVWGLEFRILAFGLLDLGFRVSRFRAWGFLGFSPQSFYAPLNAHKVPKKASSPGP